MSDSEKIVNEQAGFMPTPWPDAATWRAAIRAAFARCKAVDIVPEKNAGGGV